MAFTLKVSVACDTSIPDTIEQLREAVVREVVRITDFQVDRVDIIVAQLEEAEQVPEPEKPEKTEESPAEAGE